MWYAGPIRKLVVAGDTLFLKAIIYHSRSVVCSMKIRMKMSAVQILKKKKKIVLLLRRVKKLPSVFAQNITKHAHCHEISSESIVFFSLLFLLLIFATSSFWEFCFSDPSADFIWLNSYWIKSRRTTTLNLNQSSRHGKWDGMVQ